MFIYCDDITPRLRYAVSIVFRNCEAAVELSSDRIAFERCTGPRMAYSTATDLHAEIQLFPSGLLKEQGLQWGEPGVSQWNHMPVLFATHHGNFPFDILSAVFFMLSRYEEYQPFEGDHMNRFPAEKSLASRKGFLQRPVVDEWLAEFQRYLLLQWPGMKFTPTRFQFLSTIDVDSAFAYKNKGLYRTLGGISKDVFSLRIGNLRRRLSFILNSERDPFDTFHLLETLHEQYKVQGVFFFLLADFGKYDKNVSHRGEALRHRIAHIALGNQVGIHPGVASNQSRDRLKLECERLAEITGRPATRSRQHYLVMSFPSTYRNLIEMGIADDYTMGFAGDTGFRAGTSNAFQWYDLERETATPLMVHPFAVMDATLRFYLSLDPDQAIQRMSELLDQVRKVNGTFCTLWHNESLSELPPWQGWRRVFEEILKKA